MKRIGTFLTVVGGILTFMNLISYMETSSKTHAWYYNRSALEESQTLMFVGAFILIIGVGALFASYIKNK